MAQYHEPNPLDLLFFANEAAGRRARLAPGHIHLATEVEGELDIGRLQHAVAALHRVYPVTASRLELCPWTGRPHWRLDVPPTDPRRVVRIHELQPPTRTQFRAEYERLLAAPIDATRHAPLQFHIFHGLPPGDILVLRWPHALMDARGGGMMSEELDRLYEEVPDFSARSSAGDESRIDFQPLLARVPPGRRVQMLAQALVKSDWHRKRYAQLATEPIPADPGALRCVFRHVSPDDTRGILEHALRIGGVGRFPDFLRACALWALHEIMPHPVPPDALYTTLNLLDRRNRRQPLRWCCNLTSALPIAVPAGLVQDRQRAADLVREQTGRYLASDTPRQHAAVLWLLTRLPTAWLGAAIKTRLSPGRRVTPRLGVAPAPSLPLGLMGPTTRPMTTYCGRRLLNYYGCRPPLPDTGFAIEANLTTDRLNLTGVCYERRVPVAMLTALIDRLVVALRE